MRRPPGGSLSALGRVAGEGEESVVERRPAQRDLVDADPRLLDDGGDAARSATSSGAATEIVRCSVSGVDVEALVRAATAARSKAAPSAAITSTRCSPTCALSCAGVPAATSRPRSIRTTRSASASASSRYWVVSSSVTPSSTSSRIVDQTTCRLRGSRPVVGSSSTSTCGRSIRPAARSTRRRSPPDRSLTSRSRKSSRRSGRSARRTTARGRARPRPRSRAIRTRFSRAVRFLSSAANWPVSEISSRTRAASLTTSWPPTQARPPSGRSSVASIRTVVVLPAPLGPSSDDDGADFDLEVEIVDRDEVAEALGEALGLNCGSRMP